MTMECTGAVSTIGVKAIVKNTALSFTPSAKQATTMLDVAFAGPITRIAKRLVTKLLESEFPAL